jgi:hypothetical protein
MDKNNACLCGKLLNVCEELPAFTDHEWEKVSNKLKTYTTEDTLVYEDKYQKKFQADNITNFIINTNMHSLRNGRRLYAVDVSNECIGKKAYFVNVIKKCFNTNVGEAFYAYLLQIDAENPDWDEDEFGMTEQKQVSIIRHMHPITRYLKRRYVMRGLGLNITYEKLEKHLKQYFSLRSEAIKISYHDLSYKLKELCIPKVEKAQRNLWVVLSAEELRELFMQQHLIGDDEELAETFNDPLEVALLKEEYADLE